MYQLRKEYSGSGGNPPHVAVETISLAIQRNECFGLLGPNGMVHVHVYVTCTVILNLLVELLFVDSFAHMRQVMAALWETDQGISLIHV